MSKPQQAETRQPVIILGRGSRVDVPYSVFPLCREPGENWPSVERAMFHGSQAECEEWISQRSEHVVLYGTTYECRDWLDQTSRYARLVDGRPLPERCRWRPPEEREQELRERTANELATRGQAIEALHSLFAFVDQAMAAVGVHGGTCDEAELARVCRDACNAVSRHSDARQRLADCVVRVAVMP